MNGIMSFLKKSITSPFLSAVPEGHYKYASSEGGAWNTVKGFTGLNDFADVGTHAAEGNYLRSAGSLLQGGLKMGLNVVGGFGLAGLGGRLAFRGIRGLTSKGVREGVTNAARGAFREGVRGPLQMTRAAFSGTQKGTTAARKRLVERTGNPKAQLWRDRAGIKPVSDDVLGATALGRFSRSHPTASNWALTGGAVGGSIGLDSMMQDPRYEQQRNTNPYGINLSALAAATGSPPAWMSV